MKSVSIIIPNFNGKSLLEKNLPSVLNAKKNSANRIFEIIIVDDASNDDSLEFLKGTAGIKIIKHKVNRGFSASVNTGARSAKGNLLCLLNTDVSVEENFLEKAISHFRNNNVFAVSLHEKGYGWARGIFQDGFIIHAPGSEDERTHQTFWVNGGSGIFRRDYWIKLGGMDDELFRPFYWEDVDLSYRAHKRGWILLWEPDSRVAHKHESTIGKLSETFRNKIQERNQLIFIWNNLTSPLLFKKHLEGLIKRLMKHPGYGIIVLMTFLKIRTILHARKREIKESKISDEAIFSKFNTLEE